MSNDRNREPLIHKERVRVGHVPQEGGGVNG